MPFPFSRPRPWVKPIAPPCRWYISYAVRLPDVSDPRFNDAIIDVHPIQWIRARRAEYPNYQYGVLFFADITGIDLDPA
jgi:hypothetical protein